MSFAPSLAFAFEIRAQIAPTLHVGHGDGERTEFTPIVGGTVTRPRLSGTVLPGGGDRHSTRGEVCELDARRPLLPDLARLPHRRRRPPAAR